MTRNIWTALVLVLYGMGIFVLSVNAYFIHSDVSSLLDPIAYETYASLSVVAAIFFVLVLGLSFEAGSPAVSLGVAATCFVVTVIAPDQWVVNGWLFSWLGIAVSLIAAAAAKIRAGYRLNEQLIYATNNAPVDSRMVIGRDDLL